MFYEKYSLRFLEKLANANEVYSKMIFRPVGEVKKVYAFSTKEHLRRPPTEGLSLIEPGTDWGEEWGNLWLCAEFSTPKGAAGEKLYAVPKTGAVETLCFLDDVPGGIINSKNDFIGGMHSAFLVSDNAPASGKFRVAFECYAGHFCAGSAPYAKYGQTEPEEGEFAHRYEGITLCIRDELVKDFVFDLKTALQLATKLGDDNSMKARARDVLEQVFSVLVQDPKYTPEEIWRPSLERSRALLAPLLAHTGSEDTRGFVGIIGHSHMDTAWLWPVSETIRKCARTYSNALALMRQYPEYHFIQSSALHLDWMRRYYPDIFAEIKERVAEGRYEPNGGVWVECDCNITSGEMIVRQFLKGQRFTREHFGYTSDCFWLPDTFGYNAAIPQIMLGAGAKYFYTTKMQWNDLNEFPFDTFRWKGLDGSEVLTHFNLIHTFPDVENLVRAQSLVKQKAACDAKLLAYGFGDGGGGPTYGMLEDARRVKDLPGIPKVEHTTVSEFMHKLEAEYPRLPVYSGELYLELHRGTLTQMHNTKRGNRCAEIWVHNQEFMNVLSKTPKPEEGEELLETLLKNQFHDILPGSTLTCVNELAAKELFDVYFKEYDLAKKFASTMTDAAAPAITVFNPIAFANPDVLYLEDKQAFEGVECQETSDLFGKPFTAVKVDPIPAFSAVTLRAKDPAKAKRGKSAFAYDKKTDTLTTPFARVRFDKNGGIASFVDLASGRELRREGGRPLNSLLYSEDMPRGWDNWDIDSDQSIREKEEVKLLSREIVADGAVEFRIRSEYAFGTSSTLVQDMVFTSGSPRVDFTTVIHWNEKHHLLKAGFDLDLLASTAKHEIQFGHVERPTTANNSLEAARFEVCNYKWSDLSESRFGVAILNDCKYGISVDGGDMQLTLHKGGMHPDVTGDKGVHFMKYALLPHEGALTTGNVIAPSYCFNYPPVVVSGALNAPVEPLIQVDADNIICETIKPAEDVKDAFVARFYEAERNRTRCKVTLPADAKRVSRVNLLEDIEEELPIENGAVSLEFHPFQIVSLLIER